LLPFWAQWFFRETREFWQNLDIVMDVVKDIISKKRQQLQQGGG